ncbi:aminopeptidase P family protein [Ornithinimicrobium sp. Arc0846-15]|nr:aminopeptidase P family protein [Ornithinimicrobium laminariae]
MSEKQPQADHRSRPTGEAFKTFMQEGWAPRAADLPALTDGAASAAHRRAALSEKFLGERLVIPAGGFKVRSNDTDYVFRPHTAFAYLTGLGSDREPDALLVMEPLPEGGHESTLYFRPLAGRETDEFFADSRVGEFWVGARPTLESAAQELGLKTAHLDEFTAALGKDVGSLNVRVVADADQDVTAAVLEVRATANEQTEQRVQDAAAADAELGRYLSTVRAVKDAWEVEQMQLAVDSTATAFDAVVAALPEAVEKGRGERWIEGTFGLHARHTGNGVGYDSICAAGDHANTLHWIRNTGDVSPGDLVLIDAGVETNSLYTADVTRTLPVDGTFTPNQRQVYDAVLQAADAGIAAARPGNKFSDIHAASIRVIATKLHEWGMLPDGIDVEATLDPVEGQFHRRWMVHGTSHHLGLDVHDCAQALRADYLDGELQPGMVLTVEPGLYFKKDDELVPEQLRGIGVRIEDDLVITEDGNRNLSGALPREAEAVERWVQTGER